MVDDNGDLFVLWEQADAVTVSTLNIAWYCRRCQMRLHVVVLALITCVRSLRAAGTALQVSPLQHIALHAEREMDEDAVNAVADPEPFFLTEIFEPGRFLPRSIAQAVRLLRGQDDAVAAGAESVLRREVLACVQERTAAAEADGQQDMPFVTRAVWLSLYNAIVACNRRETRPLALAVAPQDVVPASAADAAGAASQVGDRYRVLLVARTALYALRADTVVTAARLVAAPSLWMRRSDVDVSSSLVQHAEAAAASPSFPPCVLGIPGDPVSAGPDARVALAACGVLELAPSARRC